MADRPSALMDVAMSDPWIAFIVGVFVGWALIPHKVYKTENNEIHY